MGQTLGHNDKAQKMIQWRQQVVDALSATTAKIPAQQPESCTYPILTKVFKHLAQHHTIMQILHWRVG